MANNKHLVQESSFVEKRLDHYPSCLIIIDNRKDVQNIFIEQKLNSFSDTDTVSNILKTTFNSYLKSCNLTIEILKRYKPSDFWEVVKKAEVGVEMLRFSFLYPNLPRVQEKIDKVLLNASSKIHSKKTLIDINSSHGEGLVLDENNEDLKNLVESSSESGNKIKLKFLGSRKHTSVGDTEEIAKIDFINNVISSDLWSSLKQKVLKVLDRFK